MIREASSPLTLPRPDYEVEADRGRLKVRGNQQSRRPSQPDRTPSEQILAGFRANQRNGTAFERRREADESARSRAFLRELRMSPAPG